MGAGIIIQAWYYRPARHIHWAHSPGRRCEDETRSGPHFNLTALHVTLTEQLNIYVLVRFAINIGNQVAQKSFITSY